MSNTLRRYLSNVIRFAPLFLTALFVLRYALLRGSDYNYDFVNIKGQLSWSIIHGRLGIDSQIGGRYSFPPLNDSWNVLLLGTGHWWLPVMYWSLVHSLIVVVTYFVIKEIVPEMNIYLQQIIAVTSLTSPIILMQIGTGFGHLTTSIFIGLSLLFLLRGTKGGHDYYWLLGGANLGIAILLRSSSIPTIPAYFLAASILALNSKQFISFVLGFSWVYFGISIPWAWYSSNASGLTFSGIEVIPKGIVGVYAVIAFLCISPILYSSTNRYAAVLLKSLDTRIVIHTIRAILLALVVYTTQTIYKIAQVGDPRFLITNLEMGKHRLTHTGSLIDNCCPVDLEVSYFDLRVQSAIFLFVAAIGVFFYRRSPETVRAFGLITFVTLPIFMAISYSGYIRYASQALPFVPVGLIALIQVLPLKRFLSQALLVSALICLTIPAISRLPGVMDAPRYAQLGDSNNLLTKAELSMANDLLPLKSTVYIGGPLVSLLAQQLNRHDLVWTWNQPFESEIKSSSSDFFVLYNPMEPFLEKNVLNRGVSISECSILRFQRLQLSLCRLLTR